MTELAERCWLFETLAVTVARVDFLDPARSDAPDTRERGVRVEIRPVEERRRGSVYSSPALGLGPAVCRIDLLESAPGAADRMHWHPVMVDGEPGRRIYDATMLPDPAAWLGDRLREVPALLERAGLPDVDGHRASAAGIADVSDDVVDTARDGLAWARAPWPHVRRDERGMAVGFSGPVTSAGGARPRS